MGSISKLSSSAQHRRQIGEHENKRNRGSKNDLAKQQATSSGARTTTSSASAYMLMGALAIASQMPCANARSVRKQKPNTQQNTLNTPEQKRLLEEIKIARQQPPQLDTKFTPLAAKNLKEAFVLSLLTIPAQSPSAPYARPKIAATQQSEEIKTTLQDFEKLFDSKPDISFLLKKLNQAQADQPATKESKTNTKTHNRQSAKPTIGAGHTQTQKTPSPQQTASNAKKSIDLDVSLEHIITPHSNHFFSKPEKTSVHRVPRAATNAPDSSSTSNQEGFSARYDEGQELKQKLLAYMRQETNRPSAFADTQEGMKEVIKTYGRQVQNQPLYQNKNLIENLFGSKTGCAGACYFGATAENYGIQRMKLHKVAQQTTQYIDFSQSTQVRERNVADNGFTLHGLYDVSLKDAASYARDLYTSELRKQTGEEYVDAWADALLPPELDFFGKSSDPDCQSIKYGSLEWTQLKIGIASVNGQGLDPNKYSASELGAVGKKLLEKSSVATRPGHHTNNFGNSIPLHIKAFLLMANAHGIDLKNFFKLPKAEQAKQFGAFMQSAFPQETAMLQAQADLKKGIPTRSKVAKEILQDAKFNPHQNFEVATRGWDDTTSEITHETLLDIYLESTTTGITNLIALRKVENAAQAIIDKLPNIDDTYNKAADQFANSARIITTTLFKKGLQKIISNHPGANFKLVEAEFSVKPGNTAQILYSSKVANNIAQETAQRGVGIIFVKLESPYGSQYYFLNQKKPEKGFQPLMNGDFIPESFVTAWIKRNINKVAGEPLVKKFNAVNNQYNFHELRETPSDIDNLAQAISEIFIQNYIKPLKKANYEPTSRQTVEDSIQRSLPILGTKKLFEDGHKTAGIFSAIADATIVIPAVAEFIKAGTVTATIAGELAAKGLAQAATEGVSETLIKGVAKNFAKSLPELVEHWGTAVVAGANVMNPFAGFTDLAQMIYREGRLVFETLSEFSHLSDLTEALEKNAPTLAKDLIEQSKKIGVDFKNGLWISTKNNFVIDTVIVQSEEHFFYSTPRNINGRDYIIAPFGNQADVLFKEHTNAITGESFLTLVNPHTDEAYGLKYHYMEGKVYPHPQSIEKLLNGYQVPSEFIQNHAPTTKDLDERVPDLQGEDFSILPRRLSQDGHYVEYGNDISLTTSDLLSLRFQGAEAELAKEGYFIKINKKPYYMQTGSDGVNYIHHPTDVNKKIPVEAINMKWHISVDGVPESYQSKSGSKIEASAHHLCRTKRTPSTPSCSPHLGLTYSKLEEAQEYLGKFTRAEGMFRIPPAQQARNFATLKARISDILPKEDLSRLTWTDLERTYKTKLSDEKTYAAKVVTDFKSAQASTTAAQDQAVVAQQRAQQYPTAAAQIKLARVHLVNDPLIISPSSMQIMGTHDADYFRLKIREIKLGSIREIALGTAVIKNVAPHPNPNIRGIYNYQYEYKFYSKNANGLIDKTLPLKYPSFEGTKTVYNSEEISIKQIEDMGARAFIEIQNHRAGRPSKAHPFSTPTSSTQIIPSRPLPNPKLTTGYRVQDSSGLVMEFWVDPFGNLDSYYPTTRTTV